MKRSSEAQIAIEAINELIQQEAYRKEREELSICYPSYEEMHSSQMQQDGSFHGQEASLGANDILEILQKHQSPLPSPTNNVQLYFNEEVTSLKSQTNSLRQKTFYDSNSSAQHNNTDDMIPQTFLIRGDLISEVERQPAEQTPGFMTRAQGSYVNADGPKETKIRKGTGKISSQTSSENALMS